MLNLLTRRMAPCHLAVGAMLALGLPIAGSQHALAEGSAESATQIPADISAAKPVAVAAPKAVIELFTSQGCSSCPPADKLLGKLAKREGVLGLTLAVDYWDYLGWKDTLAKHGHSVRQKSYAKVRGDSKLFTPQIILNGTAMAVGNDADEVEDAVEKAEKASSLKVPVNLSIADGRLIAKVGAGSGHGEVWLCPVASGVTVKIGRGENEGATMTYHNVVRGWIRLGEWTGSETQFDVKLDELKNQTIDSAAVLVQAGGQGAPGPILGAALAPLHETSSQ